MDNLSDRTTCALILVVSLLFVLSLIGADVQAGRVESRIKALLPDNSMLRDFEPIPSTEKLLVIYIVDPEVAKQDPDRTYSTCPPLVNGQPIRGEYHLALYEGGNFVNEATIPRYSSRRLRIIYRQTVSNIESRGFTAMNPVQEEGSFEMKRVQLLTLSDLTGDGLAHQFQIEVFGGACGHALVLTAGYSQKRNEAVVYPIRGENPFRPYYWHDNFYPNDEGIVEWEFQCADHGNDVYHHQRFVFDKDLEAYVLTESEKVKCEEKHDWWSD